ncbi:histidine ammonia-lyase [Chloracidobacterium sp. MS 40/45]|jgi:histidine ammonia-lyase|uniref:histidine ammonia-lyase n=1 Tax=Chloracidobacterium aggregatum TaxID=2851959 RepID=UPI001B8CEF92|nr:histidine ammonia-lyase [Chloracidobacterium aggregatum]QUW00090.1 histidine ammonia-lyase [Chloracidobacterium sp. MS 40/45]
MHIRGHGLTLADVVHVAHDGPVVVEIAPDVPARLAHSRALINAILAEGRIVYGVNTGFGKLSSVTISPAALTALQLNLVRSHACGVGAPLSEPETRAMMLLRANVLAQGTSGVRPVVLEQLVALLNAHVHPVIPEKGSVGASGDLSPLAHLALVLIGEGEANFQGERLPGHIALARAGLRPIALEAKEGLALLNGTQAMSAVGGLALSRLLELAELADIAGALSLDALHGTATAFDARIHAARPHPGQTAVAGHLRALLSGSAIMASHRDCPRVQDAYSLRCMPQVHGAARDVFHFAQQTLETEFNSATDNPLVFTDTGEVLSGGNFHGAPVALALDACAMAAATLGGIAERRIERLLNPDLSELPAFLSPQPGLQSGLMMAQVTAAALCNENMGLSHPASVGSLPTGAAKEDFVSMGMTAALKLRTVAENLASILAIELLVATQALPFLRPLRTSPQLQRVEDFIHTLAPPLEGDTPLTPYIQAIQTRLPDIRDVARNAVADDRT